MSYELKISAKDRASGRFIGTVRKKLINAALDEKRQTGISQSAVASKLGVSRSVINRLLRGQANLTLRTVAELAWALGWEPVFSLRRKVSGEGLSNAHSSVVSKEHGASGSENFTTTPTSVGASGTGSSSSLATVSILSRVSDAAA